MRRTRRTLAAFGVALLVVLAAALVGYSAAVLFDTEQMTGSFSAGRWTPEEDPAGFTGAATTTNDTTNSGNSTTNGTANGTTTTAANGTTTTTTNGTTTTKANGTTTTTANGTTTTTANGTTTTTTANGTTTTATNETTTTGEPADGTSENETGANRTDARNETGSAGNGTANERFAGPAAPVGFTTGSARPAGVPTNDDSAPGGVGNPLTTRASTRSTPG